MDPKAKTDSSAEGREPPGTTATKGGVADTPTQGPAAPSATGAGGRPDAPAADPGAPAEAPGAPAAATAPIAKDEKRPQDVSDVAEVLVDADRLRATLRLRPRPKAPKGLSEGCVRMLEELGVAMDEGVRTRVEKIVAAYVGDTARAREGVVAEGEAPVHGFDGYLRFEEGMDPSEPAVRPKSSGKAQVAGSEVKPDDRVDHRNRSPYRMIRRCQKIGCIVPPRPGKDGRTVTGEPIVARSAEPAQVKVDSTIELRDNGDLLALVDGALQHDENGLRVMTHLEVRGAVDFSTGNIEFAGDLTVSEGVKDCFTVVVDGTLQVRGLVEAANLKTAGDMHLHGGMAARDKGRLEVGRDLFARYLDNVDAHVGRHLFIEKELTNCTVSVTGSFLCERAHVMGGRLCVAGAVDVQALGADSGVETEVVLGRFAETDRLLDEVGVVEGAIRERTAEAADRLGELAHAGARPTPSQAAEMDRLRSEVGRLEGRLVTLSGARDRVGGLVAAHAKVDCTVRGMLHQGVRLIVGDARARIRVDVAGPVHIGTAEDGELVLTDLRTNDRVELSAVAEVERIRPDEGAEQVGRAA